MEPIPNSITRFVYANIESVDQLEILRLLAAEPSAEHASDSLAKSLGLAPEAATAQLKALHGKGLITLTSETPLRYKYGAATDELREPLRLLVDTYLERPVSLIKLVYEHQKQLRLFAEAFRLKGDT